MQCTKHLFESLAADYLLAHFFYIVNGITHRLSLQKRQALSKHLWRSPLLAM